MSRKKSSSALPTGTVTFCFSDVVGSTALWEGDPGVADDLLQRHDALMLRSCRASGGRVFKRVGDQFCMVFSRPDRALEAAATIQREIRFATWNAAGLIRLRIAVHTGFSEERDGDYFGPTLNRVARLLAVGHGGQTLVSLAAQTLVFQALPDGLELMDMGEHRLRDLSTPERIFQLVIPGLPNDFPPLATIDARRTNLPVQLTTFVGRENELQSVLALLERADVRLVTLTGAGGSGKTRLALHVGADALMSFADGVYFTELAALASPDQISTAIRSSLALPEGPGDEIETLAARLGQKKLLLILDNFEHLLKGASVLTTILRRCPFVTILVTSRTLLQVNGEHGFAVPPLPAPPGRDLSTEHDALAFDAVRLFALRAKAARFDFELTDANVADVCGICARLDGLPLAIELAAARIRSLRPTEMLSWFEKPGGALALLDKPVHAETPRHETLRAAMDWSHELLPVQSRRLFSRLSVFRGGTASEAIGPVSGMSPAHLLPAIQSLVDASFLVESEAPDGRSRYTMLETIREYARAKLTDAQRKQLRMRHAEYFLALGEHLQEFTAAREIEGLDLMEADHENLLGAIESLLETGRRAAASRLAGNIRRLWLVRGYAGEGRRVLASVLPSSTTVTEADLRALDGASALASLQSDYDDARVHALRSLRLVERLELRERLPGSLSRLGLIAWRRRQYEEATRIFEESLSVAREVGIEEDIALGAHYVAMVRGSLGDFDHALPRLFEALDAYTRLGKDSNRAATLCTIGAVKMCSGDNESGRATYAEALALYQALGDPLGISIATAGLGYLARQRGELREAHGLLREAIRGCEPLRDREQLALTLTYAAAVIFSAGDPLTAATVWAAAEGIREEIGAPLEAMEIPLHEADVRDARRQTDPTAWEAAWARGREIDAEDAIRLALEFSIPERRGGGMAPLN
jgi:predicted ATPase/class 3 adenylate cyclase